MATFASPTFGARLAETAPLLAATMKLFNEEFNVRLIRPDNERLFKQDTLLDDTEKLRKAELEEPTWIASCRPGVWVVDCTRGYTSVDDTDVAQGALGICAKQPVLDQPLNEDVVGTLRNVLEVYFFKHLAMHDLHAGIQVPASCQRASGSDYNPAQAPVQAPTI